MQDGARLIIVMKVSSADVFDEKQQTLWRPNDIMSQKFPTHQVQLSSPSSSRMYVSIAHLYQLSDYGISACCLGEKLFEFVDYFASISCERI